MTRIDVYRTIVGGILLVVGVLVVVRSIISGVWPVGLVGLLMVALGLYRLNQYRTYRALSGR